MQSANDAERSRNTTDLVLFARKDNFHSGSLVVPALTDYSDSSHTSLAVWCWCRLVSIGVGRCQLVSVGVGQCQCVSVGRCWSMLVGVGRCWSVLVGCGWCQLMSVSVVRFRSESFGVGRCRLESFGVGRCQNIFFISYFGILLEFIFT